MSKKQIINAHYRLGSVRFLKVFKIKNEVCIYLIKNMLKTVVTIFYLNVF